MPVFEIATFNSFGVAMDLKAILRRRGPPDGHRLAHPVVRERLERADLVCLQEVWIPEAVVLFEALSHEHKAHDVNGVRYFPFTIAGSGLGIASRWPVTARQARAFRCRGTHSDRFARKGWLHVRVRLGAAVGRELDLVTTHLQAGSSPGAVRARDRQLEELRSAVDELGSPERPFALCGDLNIDGLGPAPGEQHGRLRDLFLDFEDLGQEGDQPTMCPEREMNELAFRFWSHEPVQRIDYLLFRPPAAGWLQASAAERILDRMLPAGAGPATFASDHFGLAAELRLRERNG